MNILLNICVLERYLMGIGPKSKNDFEKKIDSLVTNSLNKILISEKFIDLSKDYFEKHSSECRDLFKGFLKDLYEKERYVTANISAKGDVLSEFLNLLSGAQDKYLCAFSMEENLKFSKTKGKEKISVLNKVKVPNKDWIFFTIASEHYLKVRYYDFKDKKEIESFFNDVFSLPNKINEVNIFDRLTNLNHNFYKAISKKKILIKYFKAKPNFTDTRAVDAAFGAPYEILATHNTDNVHERNVLFENFILETNEDPSNIDINRETWNISVQYSAKEYTELMKKKVKFTPFCKQDI